MLNYLYSCISEAYCSWRTIQIEEKNFVSKFQGVFHSIVATSLICKPITKSINKSVICYQMAAPKIYTIFFMLLRIIFVQTLKVFVFTYK